MRTLYRMRGMCTIRGLVACGAAGGAGEAYVEKDSHRIRRNEQIVHNTPTSVNGHNRGGYTTQPTGGRKCTHRQATALCPPQSRHIRFLSSRVP